MKKTKQKSLFLRAMGYFKPLLWRIIVLTILGIVGTVFYSFMPGLTADALDTFESLGMDHNIAVVLKPLILYLIVCILAEVFEWVCKGLIIKYSIK